MRRIGHSVAVQLPPWRRPSRPPSVDRARSVGLIRNADHWWFVVVSERQRVVHANLIDPHLAVEAAQSLVLDELAMSFGVRIAGQWRGGSADPPDRWSATLRPIIQPD